jgi:hypothetical protein
VAEHDRIIAAEDLLDHQAHQTLPLDDVERVRGLSQARKKRREGLRQTQVRRPLLRLFGDRLQFDSQRALALA